MTWGPWIFLTINPTNFWEGSTGFFGLVLYYTLYYDTHLHAGIVLPFHIDICMYIYIYIYLCIYLFIQIYVYISYTVYK